MAKILIKKKREIKEGNIKFSADEIWKSSITKVSQKFKSEKKKKGMERIQNEIYREMIINKNYPFSYSLKYDLCMQFTENQFYNFYLSEKRSMNDLFF